MASHIALLRGINVGGHNKVAMSDLCALCRDLGLGSPTSLLQSGNVVFQSDRLKGTALELLLEAETAKRLDLSIDYIVRSSPEWDKVIARNPFPNEAKSDPSHLLVMFFKTAASATNVASLEAAIQGPEKIRQDGKHLYITYPAGIGRSKLTGAMIEKKLGARGTGRNWNTVLKLAALCR
jgi:uncharacterized protein (DUF1697 family)